MTAPLRVIVTAGASGIGQAIARCFAEAGHRVHICDIDPAAIAATTVELAGVGGTVADVADPAAVEALCAEATQWLGGIDVLINNAGIGGPRGAIEDIDPVEWDRCLRVNLSGPFHMIRSLTPFMKAQRSGCIINISTTSARTGLPQRLPYVASKVGLLGLTHNVARELGPWNIRCNAILPGTIDNARGRALIASRASETGMSIAEAEQEALSYVSMRTLIAPSDIGEAALFLAGDGARHISGQEIGVCGNTEWEI